MNKTSDGVYDKYGNPINPSNIANPMMQGMIKMEIF
jgi:hypothetical protein